MKIKSAEFVISNTNVEKCPDECIPEYAFIGRSNVGKSSLINMLINHKGLAKTSGKPGKTQLINHFRINNQWFLVDLPGYGYAQISKTKRKKFQGYITDYFLKREQLVCAFILIDCRHDPQKTDLEFMQFLGKKRIPLAIIFTKTDKLSCSKLNKQIMSCKRKLLQCWESLPINFLTSSISKLGRDDILNFINQVNKNVANDFK